MGLIPLGVDPPGHKPRVPSGEPGRFGSALESHRRHPRLLHTQDVNTSILGQPEVGRKPLAVHRTRVQRPDHATIGLPALRSPRLLQPAGVGPRRLSDAAPSHS